MKRYSDLSRLVPLDPSTPIRTGGGVGFDARVCRALSRCWARLLAWLNRVLRIGA